MIARHGDLFEEARDALAHGDLDAVVRFAKRGFEACARARAPIVATAPGHYLLASAHADRGDDDAALEHVQRARAADPASGEVAHLEATLRLARWDLDGALSALAGCDDEPEFGDVPHLQALIAELQGRFADADALYQVAAARDPENYSLPVRISHDDLHALVQATIAAMPEDVVETFRNLTIDVHEMPDPVLHRDIHPETLGLYAGVPVGYAEAMPVGLPDRIYIFKRNLERIARDGEELTHELRITLLHELGHHLGWDEDDLEERGLA